MHGKGDIFRMDPFYIILFLGFGLIFGIAGTLIVYATRYFPVDRRVAGLGVFLCGCAATLYYGFQMPPTPFVPIPPLTTATGFLIHPLFCAAGILVISGFSRYLFCLRKETVFPALFFTAGITTVLGAMGFYTVLHPGAVGPGAPDFAITPSFLTGLFDTCLAAVIFLGVCEAYFLLQEKDGQQVAES